MTDDQSACIVNPLPKTDTNVLSDALLKNGHSVDGLTYDYYTFLPQYSALPYSTIPQLCIDWSSMKQRKHIQKN